MRVDTLEILRCPFCGTRLTIVENDALRRVDDRIESGVLGCECCAFPVVAGIPVLIASDTARRAMHLLEAGKGDEALHVLLALDGDRVERFRRFLADPDAMTYREGVRILSVDAEAEYFVYRFSDPTFRVGRAVVQVCGPLMAREGRYIDLCGGSGHLTRSMISNVAPGPGGRVLLEAVAGQTVCRATLRADLLRCEQPAAVRTRNVLDGRSVGRVSLSVAQAPGDGRDDAAD